MKNLPFKLLEPRQTKHKKIYDTVNDILDYLEEQRHPNFIATRSGDDPITVNRYDKDWRKGYVDEIYDEPKTLAQKFQAWRGMNKSGKGDRYWKGLEAIAKSHYE